MQQDFSHVTVESDAVDEPYAAQIRRWFLQALPGAGGQSSDVLELVFEAFMGNSKIRLGPRPNPESMVKIRSIIGDAMRLGVPIPIVTPWGSEKPGDTLEDKWSVDIAELSGIRTLLDLAARVEAAYKPGIDLRIRIEDASAPHLFYTRAEESMKVGKEYTENMVSLVNILSGPRGPLTAVPETTMTTYEDFASRADGYVKPILEYLRETDLYGFSQAANRLSYLLLRQYGWTGLIPQEQRDYYRNTYSKLYGIDPRGEQATYMLARYLAESLARYNMKIDGNDPRWQTDYLKVSLVPPIPGAPTNMAGKTMYYRTMPENVASTHLPPWRAKGYLLIADDGSMKPKLTTVRAAGEAGLTFHKAEVAICGSNGDRVSVRADYLLS